MSKPQIDLLWWEGCPSTPRAREELRAALDELGLEDIEIRMREIRSDEDAAETSFVGSPTILIDGVDVQPPTEDEPAGLACRVYRRRDGRVSAVPDPEDLREALRTATTRDLTSP